MPVSKTEKPQLASDASLRRAIQDFQKLKLDYLEQSLKPTPDPPKDPPAPPATPEKQP